MRISFRNVAYILISLILLVRGSFQGEELDDVDYRSVEDYGHDPEPRHDDEEEDEKLLEELEDKQLLGRIAAIEAENHNLKEQVTIVAIIHMFANLIANEARSTTA